MNIQYEGILKLVKSALTQEKCTLPDLFVLSDALEIVKSHHLTSLVYNGALICGYDDKSAEMTKLMSWYIKRLMQSENQMYEVSCILDAFEKEGIDCMPLKGTLLKELYPKPDMREMSDSDILIKPFQYDRIKSVMGNAGFAFDKESNHEYIFKKGTVSIEFHKMLVPSYNKDLYAYYENVWELSRKKDGKEHIYEMSDEDNYIYNFAHMAKHYRDGGVGVKHFIDLWLVRQKAAVLDEAYIIKEFKKMDLDSFYKNILDVIGIWFDDEKSNELIDYITENVFSGGAYGSWEKAQIAMQTLSDENSPSPKDSFSSRLWSKLFPSYKSMCYSYPVLEKHPILLPVMWVRRAFSFVFFPSKRKQMKETMELISPETINSYEMSLKYVGLDPDARNKKNGDLK